MKQCRTVGLAHRQKPDREGGCTLVIKLRYITLAVQDVIDRSGYMLWFPQVPAALTARPWLNRLPNEPEIAKLPRGIAFERVGNWLRL